MRKNFLIVIALAVLLPAMMFGQVTNDPRTSGAKVGYLGWPGEYQTRNIPAGTVADPGSHLTYIVDTGVNARAIAGNVDLESVASAALTPLQNGSTIQPVLDADKNGALDAGAIYQNFIAVTNTSPTMSVTVHFRYFNDNCEDILDFLVVVTCNDTLLFDPLNFVIPFTNGENTSSRLIGPAGAILSPIPVVQWGSGRFVITAAASGTTIDMDDDPEILFPFEWAGLDEECNIEATPATIPANPTLTETLSGTVRNVGTVAGFDPLNLHVFNASQISFNYLIGHLTTAIPAVPGTDQVSWAVPAWARPAVNRAYDANRNSTTLEPDGDAAHAAVGYILWGGEAGKNSAGLPVIPNLAFTNQLFLRNEVHGGDIGGPNVAGAVGGTSLYGALGTTPFHVPASNGVVDRNAQMMHFLSVADDYNGSNNAALGFSSTVADNSANISPAATTYVLQVYDNNEDVLTFTPVGAVPVSPPQIGGVSVLKITCICLRTFMNFRDLATGEDLFNGATAVDVLPAGSTGNQPGAMTLGDLAFFGNGAAFTKLGDFDGILQPAGTNIDSKGSKDISGGWIRFVRDNTVVVGPVPESAGTTLDDAFASGSGTSTFDEIPLADNNPVLGPSFMTIGMFILKSEGFGASWYLHAVASNPAVSASGDETP